MAVVGSAGRTHGLPYVCGPVRRPSARARSASIALLMPTARLSLGATQSSGSSALVIDASNAMDPSSTALILTHRAEPTGRSVSVFFSHWSCETMPSIWHHTTPLSLLLAPARPSKDLLDFNRDASKRPCCVSPRGQPTRGRRTLSPLNEKAESPRGSPTLIAKSRPKLLKTSRRGQGQVSDHSSMCLYEYGSSGERLTVACPCPPTHTHIRPIAPSQWAPADYLHVDRLVRCHARWWSSWLTGRSQRCKRSSRCCGRRRCSRHLLLSLLAVPIRCARGYLRPNPQRQCRRGCRRSTALRSINTRTRPGPTALLPRHGCTVRSDPSTCGVLQRRPPGSRSQSRCPSGQGAVRPDGCHPSITRRSRSRSCVRRRSTHEPCMSHLRRPGLGREHGIVQAFRVGLLSCFESQFCVSSASLRF